MSDLGSTWELVYGHPSFSSAYFDTLIYAEGRWLAFLDDGSGDPVAVTATGDAGDWSLCTFPAFAGTELIQAVGYGDGTWVAVGKNNIWTASTPTGTWTRSDRTGAGAGNPFRVGFDGTYWVEATPTTIYTASTATGARTSRATLANGITDLQYLEGVWVATAQQTTPSYAGKVYSASNPTGSWTLQATVGTTGGRIYSWPDGWVAAANGETHKAPALTGTWSSVTSDSGWLPIAYAAGDYVAVDRGVDNRNLRASTALAGPYFDIEFDTPIPYDIRTVLYAGGQWLACGWYLDNSVEINKSRFAIWRASEGGDGWGVILS